MGITVNHSPIRLSVSISSILFLTVTTLLGSLRHCQAETDKILVCYWGAWSVYRPAPGNFSIENFDAHLCTHILYSFALIDQYGYIIDADENSQELYKALLAKKRENPTLKILLAIGGDSKVVSNTFSKIASDPELRQTFINSATYMITTFKFDGIDMDWEYPNGPGDKQNFVTLLEEMRIQFDQINPGQHFLLTAAVGCGPETIADSYDVAGITVPLDFIHLMAYDLKMYLKFGDDEQEIGHHACLFKNVERPPVDSPYQEQLNIDWIVQKFMDLGADPTKLVLGVGTYGHTYTMTSRDQHNFRDIVTAPGPKGPFADTAGTWSYSEICHQVPLSKSRWEFHFDEIYQIPYAFNDEVWVGFDDEDSAVLKTNYALNHGLGGMMIWSIDHDDCNNICEGWYACPITSAIKRRLDAYNEQQEQDTKSKRIEF